jgi:hypothetical protein
MTSKVSVSGGFRTNAESEESNLNEQCFNRNPSDWEKKLENFPKYVKRQNLTRFVALYEIFKKVLPVKGSIIECGVYEGFGLMTWAKLSAILEPVNLMRKVYGFDTFSGFPGVSKEDRASISQHVKEGDLFADAHDELAELTRIYDTTRFLGHVEKVKLIKGNAVESIPEFIDDNPHLLVSLLFLDFDLYEPTKIALEHFVPRMPKGSIIAFDELDNPLWPGETLAMIEYFSKQKLEIRREPFDPYIGYAILQ